MELYCRMLIRLMSHSWYMVAEKLYQDMILGFDWLQSVNPQVDQVNYGVTLRNDFVAADITVYHTVKVKLSTFKALSSLLHANKLKNCCFTFVK